MTVAIKDTCPIKVCFIAPKAYPIFNPAIREVFGGAQLDLYLLATELAKETYLLVENFLREKRECAVLERPSSLVNEYI